MKIWTPQAEQRLTEYLDERARREGFTGDEAAELKQDLRCHIHEEAERSLVAAIGLMQLESILGRLDAGYRPPVPPQAARQGFGNFRRWTFFGVILPLLVVLFESVTAMCGSTFFNPVPTWWHVAWLSAVPGLNFMLLRGWGRDGWRGAAAGFALITASFYGLLFLPMIHLSILALLFLGLGLLSLTPVLAAIASWRIGRLARLESDQPQQFRSGWWIGALAALAVLASLEGPALWTRSQLATATAGEAGSEAAINRLRAFHSERTLLLACYEGSGGRNSATDISGWILQIGQDPFVLFDGGFGMRDSGADRDVFFRVTGKPFNSLPPPAGAGPALGGRRDSAVQEFEFDSALGGDAVAMRLKNLDLTDSRFDGHADTVSRLGYGEWTMVFTNRSDQPKEARCQVRLPREGHVSRLTLWVNGEPREAAFSTVAKVKEAYRSVAVVQRRDPVLVNVVGPDTVMVQCFPVPARGEMKIRLGITAPLEGGRWEMPHIVERNFGIAGSLEHAVWLQGDLRFELAGTGKPLASARDGTGHSLPVSLAAGTLTRPGIALQTGPLPPQPETVWCEDRFASAAERYLVREPVILTQPPARQVVVVIDGSASLAKARDWIARSLAAQDAGKFTLLLADDHARHVQAEDLAKLRFSGGRDNEQALREGIRLARESDAPVVWIHGPQAVNLSQPEALLQSLERGTNHPEIHDVDAVAGPNRLAEALHRTGRLRRGPSLVNPQEDLTRFLQDLVTEHPRTSWSWKRSASDQGLAGKPVWDQLARHWAATAVDQPSLLPDATKLSELAARYQLVTAVSGAVVLETAQQYKDHGLTPVDPDATPAIPSVPEPSLPLLLMVGGAAALLRRQRTA